MSDNIYSAAGGLVGRACRTFDQVEELAAALADDAALAGVRDTRLARQVIREAARREVGIVPARNPDGADNPAYKHVAYVLRSIVTRWGEFGKWAPIKPPDADETVVLTKTADSVRRALTKRANGDKAKYASLLRTVAERLAATAAELA